MRNWNDHFSKVNKPQPATFGAEGIGVRDVAKGGATVITWAISIAGLFVAWTLGRQLIAQAPAIAAGVGRSRRHYDDEDEDERRARLESGVR
jgi:hypothetical protein